MCSSDLSAHAKLPYDSLTDLAGVSRVAFNPLIICVHPSLPAHSVKELVALARARPRELERDRPRGACLCTQQNIRVDPRAMLT